MKMHNHAAYHLALASMLTATIFGCQSTPDAVKEVASAELAMQSQENRCCPQGDGWTLSESSSGNLFFDQNQDGLVCVRSVNGQGSSQDDPGFTIKDNNNPCESCQNPGGSYTLSCFDCSQSGDILACGCCFTIGGDCQETEINVCGCTGDIANCDGVLTCGTCEPPPVRTNITPNGE